MHRLISLVFALAVASSGALATWPPNGKTPTNVVVGGEWEPTRAQIMRWALFYPDLEDVQADLVDALQEHVEVWMLVDDASGESQVRSALAARGVPLTNVVFIHERTDSIWTRDYGPQYVRAPLGEPRIVDAIYYISRTRDDVIPFRIGAREGVPVHEARYEMEHGNLMGEGHGHCFYTTAAYTKNPSKTQAEIDAIYRDFYGCREATVLQPLPGESTGHIDMFARMVDAVTWLVGEYQPGQTGYQELENNAALLAATIAHDGLPYRVIRLPMPTNQAFAAESASSSSAEGLAGVRGAEVPPLLPAYDEMQRRAPLGTDAGEVWRTHANSVIANDIVIVPTYGRGTDAEALQIYRDAMPGYTVIGIDSEALIQLGGALHCIVMQVPDDAPFAGVAFAGVENRQERLGNGDLGFDPGETWSFDVRIENRGGAALADVRARLALPAGLQGVRLLEDELSFGTIAAGATALSTTRAVVALLGSVPCDMPLALDLVAITAGGEPAGPDQPAAVALTVGSETVTTLFLDDFESGGGAWTHSADGSATDLWAIQGAGGCYESYSPQNAWSFVDQSECEYYTAGTAAGFLDSPPIAGIGAGTKLDLRYWREVDFCSRSTGVTKRDHFRIQISTNDFATRTTLHEVSCKDPSHAQWIVDEQDLAAYAGQTIRLRFWFDSDDGFGNRWRGAGVDDVRVVDRAVTCAPFATPGPGALTGDVAGGDALFVAREDDELLLTWGLECNAAVATDYAAYAGSLTALRAGTWDHAPLACTDEGDDRELRTPLGSGSRWFVIAPHDGAVEGSLGATRPPSTNACFVSQPASCP